MGIKTEIKVCINNNLEDWKEYLCEDNDFQIDITFATNKILTEWNYQLGDNSFIGPCYHLPIWAIGCIDQDTTEYDLFEAIIEQFRNDERTIDDPRF